MAWFPLGGALVGAVGAGVVLLSVKEWPSSVAAMLGLMAMAVLTGGLHLDGFSDTVDGLAAWKNPESTLQIMKDSRIGALGAVALFFLLGLKWLSIRSIPTNDLWRVLLLVGALSRWAMVLSAQWFPYVPGKAGIGRLATEVRSMKTVGVASLFTLGLGLWAVGPAMGIFTMAVTGIILGLLNQLFLWRLGGITGDTLGAVNEAVEVILLLCLVTL